MQPRLWGHVFDSRRAMRENSSKHTNLCFLPPSAREEKRTQEAPPPPRGAQGRGRADGPGGDAERKGVASHERTTRKAQPLTSMREAGPAVYGVLLTSSIKY